MTRVAILHFTAPPAVGGVESLITAQVQALRRAGITVRVIAGGDIALPDVESTVIPAMHPMHRDTVTADDLAHPLQAALEGCDACWVHNAFTTYLHPGLTTALCRLAGATPLAWVAWCEDVSAASAFWCGDIPRLPAGLRHVTISKARRKDLVRYHGVPEESVTVILPPLDPNWLPLGPATRATLEAAAWRPGRPLVVVPAKLLPHKNLPYAARAVAALPAACPQPALVITGAASPHDAMTSARVADELRQVAEGLSVSLSIASDIGRLERSDIRDLLLAADAALLPSLEEGFGLPVLEALALRVPLVCSDIPAFREAAGDAALFADPHRPEQAAGLLRAHLDSPAARRRRAVISGAECFARQVVDLARETGCGG